MNDAPRRRRRRRNQISGTFSARLIEMLESFAYRVLSLSARRVLDRIEIEHAHHGGADNGELPVTFEHFEEYGMDRHAIAPALRELEALGFIEVTERGCAGNAESRHASLYRLTYRASEGILSDGSHEWRRIATIDEARKIADTARKTPPENRTRRGGKRVVGPKMSMKDAASGASSKIKTPVGENHTDPSGGNPH
jgi:hypothetical protein